MVTGSLSSGGAVVGKMGYGNRQFVSWGVDVLITGLVSLEGNR